MIIKDGIEFHAAELRRSPGIQGDLLARVPGRIACHLSDRGRHVVTDSVATEIRFVTECPNTRIFLSAIQPEFGIELLETRIYFGDFEFQTVWLKPGVVTTVMINKPPMFGYVNAKTLRKDSRTGFAPQVCRIVPTRGGLIYCGIDTFGYPVRPPKPSEKPSKTCLFYGSSITNSSADGFPSLVGKRLGIDIVNLGLSGSCGMEKELVDWVASLDCWDAAVLEVGINLMHITPEDFGKRADHMLRTLLKKHPEKPILLLTLFPSIMRTSLRLEPLKENRDELFCGILRKLYAKYAEKGNLHLVEGDEILDDPACLSADILHPKVFGHAVMGMNLAEKLRPLLAPAKK